MRELEDEVAIVTGAARNIGRRIAETLSARGASVACLDLASCDETVASIAATGGRAYGIEVDLTDGAAVDAAVAEVLARSGRIDILVNNAGVFAGLVRRPFWEIDVGEWEQVFAANVRSVFLISKAVAGPMRAAGQGRIVNIASNVVVFGMANLMHYVASKAAVVGMTRAMARELGPYGIRVNAVAPGLVETPLTVQELPPEYRSMVVEGQCLKVPLQPEDVAEAVAFLASPRARLITGQTLLVNAGASMGPA